MASIGAGVGAHRSLLGLVAAIVGLLVGGASVLFTAMIRGWTWVSTGFTEYSTHPGAAHAVLGIPAWVLLLIAPVLAALLYGPLVHRFAPSARGHGIPEVMLAVRRKGGAIPGRVAVVKLIASSLTIGSGGSAGREGPIVQVGASLGSSFARVLGLETSKVVLLASCGAAGGIAATFHAPLAGAVFALEVILTRFTAETFGYVVVSSVTASIVARAFQGDASAVRITADVAEWALRDLWWVGVLGVLAGLVGLGFSKLLYAVEDGLDAVWARVRLPEWARATFFAPLHLLVGPHQRIWSLALVWLSCPVIDDPGGVAARGPGRALTADRDTARLRLRSLRNVGASIGCHDTSGQGYKQDKGACHDNRIRHHTGTRRRQVHPPRMRSHCRRATRVRPRAAPR